MYMWGPRTLFTDAALILLLQNPTAICVRIGFLGVIIHMCLQIYAEGHIILKLCKELMDGFLHSERCTTCVQDRKTKALAS